MIGTSLTNLISNVKAGLGETLLAIGFFMLLGGVLGLIVVFFDYKDSKDKKIQGSKSEKFQGPKGCIAGAIFIILGIVLFIFGFLASLSGQSMWEGTPNWFTFWLFAMLSIGLLIYGIILAIKGSPEDEEIIEKATKGETFNYIVNLCPYCGSANIKSTVVDKANTPEEKKTQGFTEKYLSDCDNCKSTWFAVEK